MLVFGDTATMNPYEQSSKKHWLAVSSIGDEIPPNYMGICFKSAKYKGPDKNQSIFHAVYM